MALAEDSLGGTSGNEILTGATAVVLTLLLLAEGVTVIRMNGLVTVHMFIGMVLIPPLLLKLGSTGYRFARYYAGSRTTARPVSGWHLPTTPLWCCST